VASPANADASVLTTPVNTDLLACTTCADLDVTFTDAPGGEQLIAANYISKAEWTFTNDANNGGTGNLLAPVTVTFKIDVPAGTLGTVGNGGFPVVATTGSTGGGVGCVTSGGPLPAVVTVTCTTTTNMTPGQLFNVIMTVSGTGASNNAQIRYQELAPTCNVAQPCTDGVVSPGNSDGSDLTNDVGSDTPPTTDGIDIDTLVPSADLDTMLCLNILDLVCVSDGNTNADMTPAEMALLTIVCNVPQNCIEDLVTVANWNGQSVYVFDNDGSNPISGLGFSGSIDPASTAVFMNGVVRPGISLQVSMFGLPTGQFNCPTVISTTALSWNCTGATLGADDNALFGPDIAVVVVQVQGTNGGHGETIIYNATAPTCTTPGACTDGVVSPANSDGSDLTPGPWLKVTDQLL